jgi:hypothetical protein
MGAFSAVLHFFLKATREALDNAAEKLDAIQSSRTSSLADFNGIFST